MPQRTNPKRRNTALPVAQIPVRGALKVEVGTSSPALEAGRPFSVFVTVTNPYEVAVELTSVTTVVPVEFLDLERLGVEREQKLALRRAEKQAADSRIDANVSMVLNAGAAALGELAKLLPFYSLFNAALRASKVIVATAVDAPKPKLLSANSKSTYRLLQNKKDRDFQSSESTRQAVDDVRSQLEAAERARTASTKLSPGNSSVRLFTLQTTRSLFFPPSTYEIPIEVKYKVGGVENQEIVRYSLNIRSPLHAVIAGSVVGSFAGFLLRDIFEEQQVLVVAANGSASSILVWIAALLGNLVLAVVTVVALARKRETQPFISVEDFWGGLFVGAVAGYSGKTMLHGLLDSKLSPSSIR